MGNHENTLADQIVNDIGESLQKEHDAEINRLVRLFNEATPEERDRIRKALNQT